MNTLERSQRVARLALRVTNTLGFLAPLLTRVLVGYAFFVAGRGKLGNLENVTQFFEGLGIPMPGANAWFIAHLECYGGLLLIAGLATRPLAGLLFSTMVVALLTADRPDLFAALSGEGDKGVIDLTPVAYGLFLGWLVLYGPGLLSIDALLRRWWGIDTTECPSKVSHVPAM